MDELSAGKQRVVDQALVEQALIGWCTDPIEGAARVVDALDLPARDARVRAQAAKEEEGRRLLLAIDIQRETREVVAEEIERRAADLPGGQSDWTKTGQHWLKRAAEIARAHGRTDQEEQCR
jgi:hypothetical protein